MTREQRLEALLREWRATADLAMDITFVPIAKKTDAALAAPVPNADTQDTAMEELRSQHSCTVEPEALRLAQEFVSDPDRRAQVKFNLAAGGYLLVADLIDEAVEVSRELIRLDEALRARQEEPPNHGVSFCTIRDGGDEWHLECRMVNGQKGAFVRVDKECEGLADFLAAKLNASKDAVLTEPTQPAQITASNGAELVNIQRPTAFAAPSEGALMAQTPLETAQEWADWIPYPDSPAAEWDRFNLANGFLRLREKVGSLEACLSIQEDAERQALSPATSREAVTLAQEIIDRYRDNIYQDDIAEVILAREVQRLLKEREMVAFDHRMAFCALEDENKALRGSAALGMAEPDGA